MTKKVNYKKILANSLEAFFATLAGLLSADALLNLSVPLEVLAVAAIVPAGIQFGLTFCHEWGKAEPETCEPEETKIKVNISKPSYFKCWCSKLSNWVFFE
jgi:hypothetical protein